MHYCLKYNYQNFNNIKNNKCLKYHQILGNQTKLGIMGNYMAEILSAHFLNEKIVCAAAMTISVLARGNISNR